MVNVNEIQKRFVELGWSNLSVSDTVDVLAKQGIPAAGFVAYLDAALALGGGFNDQTVAGLTPADATKITVALKARGVAAV